MKNIEIAILTYEMANKQTIFGTPLSKQQLMEIKLKLQKYQTQQQGEELEYGL